MGGDGVIFALPPVGETDFAMRIYNSDGSEPEMCGNGIRCLARFVADEDGKGVGGKYRIHTLAGLIQPELLEGGQVRVDMGEPILEAGRVPTTLAGTRDVGGSKGVAVQAPLVVDGREWAMTCVSMGNPHAITYSCDGGKALKVSFFSLSCFFPPPKPKPTRRRAREKRKTRRWLMPSKSLSEAGASRPHKRAPYWHADSQYSYTDSPSVFLLFFFGVFRRFPSSRRPRLVVSLSSSPVPPSPSSLWWGAWLMQPTIGQNLNETTTCLRYIAYKCIRTV